jgi:hypothetical protein
MTSLAHATALTFAAWILTLLVSFTSVVASALPGQLNPNFGNQGVVIVPGWAPDTFYNERAPMLPMTGGGMMFAYGCTLPTQENTVCVGRIAANGVMDATFGANGSGILDIPRGNGPISQPLALWRTGTHYLLLTVCNADGSLPQQPCVHRFNEQGVLDTSFGANGRRRIGIEVGRASVIRLFDGRFMLSYTCVPEVCHAIVDESGALDMSFGDNGEALPQVSTELIRVLASAPRPNGETDHFVFCGPPESTSRMCRYRLDRNGFLDASIAIPPYQAPGSFSAVRARDGSLFLGQRCVSGVDIVACVQRVGTAMELLPSGDWNTLTSAGRNAGSESPGVMMHLQHDGKLLQANSCGVGAVRFTTSICLSRRHADGSLDRSYGTNGVFVFDAPQFSVPNLTRAIIAVGFVVDNAGSAWVMGSSQQWFCENSGACSGSPPDRLYLFKLQGGPSDERSCNGDIDGDGVSGSVQDQLLFARAAIGFRGNNVANADTFLPAATRNTWPAIRDYLSNHCNVRVLP